MTDSELEELFNSNKNIQDDINGMIVFSIENEVEQINNEDKLDYFINECRNGVYQFSYLDRECEVVV